METSPLKSFGTWARRELITQVSARLTAVRQDWAAFDRELSAVLDASAPRAQTLRRFERDLLDALFTGRAQLADPAAGADGRDQRRAGRLAGHGCHPDGWQVEQAHGVSPPCARPAPGTA